MADRDLRDEISELEERVEALAESLDRCRKIMPGVLDPLSRPASK